MANMSVSLTDGLKSFVDRQVEDGSYETGSEYVRELIRREQERQALRALLVEGAASPAAGIADANYFSILRGRAGGEV